MIFIKVFKNRVKFNKTGQVIFFKPFADLNFYALFKFFRAILNVMPAGYNTFEIIDY